MEEEKFEFRMYGLVPYNLSPIQQGIQYGHALQEYNNEILEFAVDGQGASSEEVKNFYLFHKWAKFDKTFIILNGGTTNNNLKSPFYGSMNQHLETLQEAGVIVNWFCEPDLGDQLTAIVFLVDERVFNRKKYPDFVPTNGLISDITQQVGYKEWVESVGGTRNVFLREFLRKFKLA